MSKKCTPLWCEAHFEVQNVKNTRISDHFWTFRCRFAWQAQLLVDLVKSEAKREGFVAFPKTMAGVGDLKRICKDGIFRGRRSTRWHVHQSWLGGPGADFLRGVAFWSIISSVLGTWFCVTGAALRMTWHHFFVAGAVLYIDRWSGKIAKPIGTRPSALHSTFHFWRIGLAELLRVWCCQVKKWGSLAELLRFWCCQVQKLRKSRWIAAFLMLSS